MQYDRIQAFALHTYRFSGKMLRVSAYAGFLLTLLLLLGAWKVREEVGVRGLAVGRELSRFADLLSGTRRITLNGESIYVASALSNSSPREILDRFEQHCREHTGGLAEQFDAWPADVREEIAKRAPAAWDQRLGIVREERSDESSIVCVDRRDGNGLADTVERLQAFAKTGDVGQLGNLRYVYVRPTENGKSQVLTTLTEGSFNLYKILGEGLAEPAGSDPRDAPRPVGSTRRISAEIGDGMYGAYVFSSAESAGEIGKFYGTALPQRGWLQLVDGGEGTAEVWQRDGVTMVVTAAPEDVGSQTAVTLIQGRAVPQGG